MTDPVPTAAPDRHRRRRITLARRHARPTHATRRTRRTRREPGASLVYRSRSILTVALAVSNLGGAVIVFAFSVWLLPSSSITDAGALVRWNAFAAITYALVATIIGATWGRRSISAHEEWLIEDRPPTATEIDRTLTAPRRLMIIQGSMWAIAAVGFTLVNGILEPALIPRVGMTVIGGGLTTATLTFLLAERITRPVVTRALEFDPEPDRHAAGVTSRTLLAWSMGTAVPLIGILAAAIGYFITGQGSPTQLAVAMVALGGVGLVVGFFITLLGVRSFAGPVRSVRKAMARIAEGDLDASVEVNSSTEVGRLQAGFNRMAAGLREREELRDLFGQHVGTDVARTALERGIDLRGETRQATVVFVDVVASTGLAEHLPPRDVFALLNRLFTVVIEVVDDHHGWINKFVGDAAMAVFGVPEWIEDHPGAALATARVLAVELAARVPELDFGIGVATGTVVAGHLGDERRYEYTIIGDMVNVAARLTDVAKGVAERVLADAATVAAASPEERDRWSPGAPRAIRGRREPVAVAVPIDGLSRAAGDRSE
ncbi:MAG: HAMP domain-containing protein [Actinobacteria bacterium]|nr:HAMP domain-containing protein [Actinomycetota bacterium]